jgi:beta-phosphoglucomutase-like phosphatase (HAD superfamily)
MTRPILALDADGVLVDLHAAYATAWRQAFGVALIEQDPQAYWPMDRWGVGRLEGERRR